MKQGVDPIGIGVIALGVVMLIILVVVSNNMMPDPLPAPQTPDLNGLARKIEDPLSAAVGAAGGMGAPMMGGPAAPGGFAPPAPTAPMGGPAAPAPPAGGGGGGLGRRGEMPEDY
jgi:hypothetical protein